MNSGRNMNVCLVLLLLAGSAWGGPLWLLPPALQVEADSLLASPGPQIGSGQEDEDPALSPDGRWLAWSRCDEGNRDVWLLDLQADDIPRPQRLTQHVAADHSPVFRQDGKAIFFISNREDAAGDLWVLPLKSRFGKLKAGKPRVLLAREGEQDHPCMDDLGGLVWDEESPLGRRVMRLSPGGELRELALPAGLPRPGHGGLYLLGFPQDAPMQLEWLPDSLLDSARPRTTRQLIRRFDPGLIDYQVDPDGGLWWIRLVHETSGRPGLLPEAGSTLEHFTPGDRMARPLLGPERVPRQLSAGGGRLAVAEDLKPSTIRLELDEGLYPLHGDPAAWLALARAHHDEPRAASLYSQVASRWPGSPEARTALLHLIDLRVASGAGSASAQHLIELGESWSDEPSWQRRLALRRLQLAELLDTGVVDSLRLAWRDDPDVLGNLLLVRIRHAVAAGERDRALAAIAELRHLPGNLPLVADGLNVRLRLLEDSGEREAVLGVLRELAEAFPERPELLARWLAAQIELLPGSPEGRRHGLLLLLDELRSIRPLRMALVLELIRLELDNEQAAFDLAREDLAVLLQPDPAGLGPLERRVWCEAAWFQAGIEAESSGYGSAARLLEGYEEQLAASPELAAWLRAHRLDLLYAAAREQFAGGDPVLAAALCGRILLLDHRDTRAWRLRMEALSHAGGLDEEEDRLRDQLALAGSGRLQDNRDRAIPLYALGLLLSWKAEEDPGELPESQVLLDEALVLDPQLVGACLAQSWNLSRELALARGKRGGLRGLLRELGRGSEAIGRLRHRGIDRLEDPDEESLRDRAIQLLRQGLRHVDRRADPELAAALEQNLGNLFFSQEEFGSARARAAWLRRLRLDSSFSGLEQAMLFRAKLGISAHWDGDLSTAGSQLQLAESLAVILDRAELRKAMLGRMALIDLEGKRPGNAISRFRQCLALELDPGQRALLLRDMALLEIDWGSESRALELLEEGAAELARGEMPFPREQNWLRLQFLGISLPLWNFPDLYTGEGRLEWGAPEEELLRRALSDELHARKGRLDLEIEGLDRRIRILRSQDDQSGQFELELKRARKWAARGEYQLSARACMMLARRANEELQAPGLVLRALEGLVSVAALAAGDEASRGAMTSLLAEAKQMLDDRGDFCLDLACRLQQDLLTLRTIDLLAGSKDLLEAFLLRGEGLLLIEDLRADIRRRDWQPSVEQWLSIDAAEAHYLLAIGEAGAARERLASRDGINLPPRLELMKLSQLLACALAEHDVQRGAELVCTSFQALDQLPPRAEQQLPLAQEDLLLQQLRAAVSRGWNRQGCGPGDAAAFEDWHRWWLSRRSWEQVDPEFGDEALQLLWNRRREDASRRVTLLRRGLQSPQAALQEELAGLELLIEQDNALVDSLPAEDRIWFRWWPGPVSKEDSQGCAALQELIRQRPVLSQHGLVLVGENPPAKERPRFVAAEQLLALEPAGLEASHLLLDGRLVIQPGSTAASWIEFGSQRVELRDLLRLRLNGDCMLIRDVDWGDVDPADWAAGRSVLERLLAGSGPRSLLLPLPGTRLSTAELTGTMTAMLEDPALLPAGEWMRLGAAPLERALRDSLRRSSFEDVVLRGRSWMKAESWRLAWRDFRLALGIAVDENWHQEANRLVKFAALAAQRGELGRVAWPELNALLAQMDSAAIDWRQTGPALVLLADLAGEPRVADSLWEAHVAPATSKLRAEALLERIDGLVRFDALERGAELARSEHLLPLDANPRPALFLAKLYLDTEWNSLARLCIDSPLVQWPQLPPLYLLDYHELRALTAIRLERFADAEGAMSQASDLVAAHPFKAERHTLHLLRRTELAWRLGEWPAARLLLAEAGDLMQQVEHPGLELQLANLAGLVAMKSGRLQVALQELERARDLAMEADDPLELSAVCNNLARLALLRDQVLLSLEWCDRAAEADARSGSLRRQLVTMRNRAQAEARLSAPQLILPDEWLSLPGALLEQRSAAGRIDELGAAIQGLLADPRVAEHPRDSLRLALELCELDLLRERHGRVLKRMSALQERARQLGAREDELLAGLLEARALAPDDKRGERRRAALAALLSELQIEQERSLGLRFDPDRGRFASRVADELVELEAGLGNPLAALVASEFARSLSMRELLARREGGDASPPAGAQEIRELVALLPADMEVLAWHAGSTRLRWFHHAGGRWSTGLAGGESITALRRLSRLHLDRLQAYQSIESTGRKLALALLPDSLRVHPPARLLAMPHGFLHELPLATLVPGYDSLLIEHTALQQVGSFTMLKSCLAAGIPAGSPVCWVAGPSDPGPDLAFAEFEARELEWLHTGTRVLEGAAATESSLYAAGPAMLFHLACHAEGDDSGPAGSALLLGASLDEDGHAGAAEIARRAPASGLVVLSACDTGRKGGDVERASDLPRAFVAAGARNVLASGWKVEDLSTARMMKHFHRALARGMAADLSLQLAQLDRMNSPESHPAHWAAFQLYGPALELPVGTADTGQED